MELGKMYIRTHSIDCNTAAYLGQTPIEEIMCQGADDLKSRMGQRYGKFLQPAFQLLPNGEQRQIGWIFVDAIRTDDGKTRGVETWVEVFASPPIEMTNYFNFDGKQYGH